MLCCAQGSAAARLSGFGCLPASSWSHPQRIRIRRLRGFLGSLRNHLNQRWLVYRWSSMWKIAWQTLSAHVASKSKYNSNVLLPFILVYFAFFFLFNRSDWLPVYWANHFVVASTCQTVRSAYKPAQLKSYYFNIISFVLRVSEL